MKTYDEYMDNIQKKAKAIKKRRRILASTLTTVFVFALALGLFYPFGGNAQDDTTGLKPPVRVNDYAQLAQKLKNTQFAPSTLRSTETIDLEFGSSESGLNGSYREVTDNQVEGVIEGDCFKRSDRYLYHLYKNELRIYAIDGEKSGLITAMPAFKCTGLYIFSGTSEMFLSEDCTKLTLVSRARYGDSYCTVATLLDVSNAEKVTRLEQIYFAGRYLSARMVDGDILLCYRYGIDTKSICEEEYGSFVPVYGQLQNMQPMDIEDIYCPELPANASYTVAVRLDEDLKVLDMKALLGYTDQIYVSKNCIYLSSSSSVALEDGSDARKNVTQITAISYGAEQLELLGTAQVDGTLSNQYYMDEYEGILRVATSTLVGREEMVGQYSMWLEQRVIASNCNLYCIDMKNGEILSSVIGFAPDGEQVTSARFVGTGAYICTAQIQYLSDPVYFFDLSDVHKITCKHTPVIDGYSRSLIDFGDHLVGVGINDLGYLKVEVYRQTETAVESVTSYEPWDTFGSMVYKDYLIDRENQLIGLPIIGGELGNRSFVVLHFDGQQLQVVQQVQLTSWESIRATVIDGYLYVLSTDLQVVALNG